MVKVANVLGASVTFVCQLSFTLLSTVPHFLEASPTVHVFRKEFISQVAAGVNVRLKPWSIRIFHFSGHIKRFGDEYLSHVDPYKS